MSTFIVVNVPTVQLKIEFHTLRISFRFPSCNSAEHVAIKLKYFTKALPKHTTVRTSITPNHYRTLK